MMIAVLLMVAFAVGDTASSSFTLNNLYARPLTLERAGQHLPVWLPRDAGLTQPDNTARPVAGVAAYFGQSYIFRAPDGEEIACEHMLYWIWCESGWQVSRSAERTAH